MARRLTASDASPLSWWLLAISMAVVAGVSQDPLSQILISGGALLAIVAFREQAPWSRSVKFYLFLAGFVVMARVLFRIVFNIQNPDQMTFLCLLYTSPSPRD